MAKKIEAGRLTIDEIRRQLAEKRRDLLIARRSNTAGDLVNPHAITSLRKEIARLMTLLNTKSEKEAE